ncbi:hypothetical protein VTO42DRAFT_3231 [Malbranchea cinnamomea]
MDNSQQAELQALIHEARTLAQALHAPGNAGGAKAIQERLHALQKSGAGWIIADGLLGSDDPNVRFFGALTLTMKIHQEWDQLGEERTRDLLIRLVDCHILLLSRENSVMVMRKFLTCMTAFFFKPNSPWTYCVRHVALSIARGKYVPEAQTDRSTFEQLALPSLSFEHLAAVLTFSTTLAEEASRYSMLRNDFADRLEANLEDALLLINFSFHHVFKHDTTTSEGEPAMAWNLAERALESLHAWLQALRDTKISPPELPSMVSLAMDYTTQLLIEQTVDQPLASTSMELLTETLSNQPKLLGPRHLSGILEFLAGPKGERYTLAILHGNEDPDVMHFLELLTQYITIEQVNILTREPEEKHGKILFLMYKLFQVTGYPGVDDRVISQMLEYWTAAADDINLLMMDRGLEINDIIKRNFMQVILECHGRLRYPDTLTLKEWDDDDLACFTSVRRDFSDYLLASYPLLGLEIVKRLQESAIAALSVQDWDNFEVSMFSLACLSEAIHDNEQADDILGTLFHSPIFNEIWASQRDLPPKTRQTLADVIAKYTQYFDRDHSLLPAALTFLFNSLGLPSCAHTVSKAISTLCRDCRRSLPAYVNEFVDKFDQLRTDASIPAHALERVAEGVAAVIQAVPLDTTKASLLINILRPFYEQAVIARQEKQSGQYETGLASALTVARCTASIGRGLRAPDDSVIDLEGECTASQSGNFWTTDPTGSQVQTYVISILDIVVSEFALDGEIVETTCDVLKAGYTERVPGPYVLPPEVTVRFVEAVNANSPRFSTVMGTASAFLAAHASHPSEVHAQVVDLSMHVYQLIRCMERNPHHYDPEVAHSCIDFLHRLLPKYKDAFFSLARGQLDEPPPIHAILTFTLGALKRPDPLPLRAACAFWATLLSLPDPPPEFTPSVESGTRPTGPPTFIDKYLKALAEVVIRQVAGGCSRSDLDSLSDIIKKFVFKHQGAARLYLGQALQTLDIPPPRQQQQQQQGAGSSLEYNPARFLARILALRGARGTNQAVKDFWISCRGQGFAYAS